MIQHLTIPRDGLTMAADLHLPDDLPDGLDPSQPRPAIVLSTPGSSVKEQIGAVYASRLARRGFVALVFDPSHQGRSDGEPRDLEDPYRRSEDISFAMDTLDALPGVDPRRVGALGICAGGGYAVHTARTDHRIRALGTVVAGDMGTTFRSEAFSPDGPVAALDRLAAARTQEAAGLTPAERVRWLPDTLEEAAAAGVDDVDTLQALTYYRTPRGQNEYSTNRRLARSDSLLIGFDPFHLVEQLLTQPLQVVVAGRRGNTFSYEAGLRLFELAPNAVDLLVVEGAGHYDMYDEPRYVDQAVARLADFYRAHL